MIVRGITGDGSWLFGKGRNDYKRSKEAIAQNIKTRLKSFLGDCFFDLNAGIDWPNLLGTKDPATLKLAISACILNTEGVTGINLLNYSLSESRTLSLQYTVDTVEGVVSDKYQYSIGV